MNLLFCLLLATSLFNNSHDITTLNSWGPYSKLYSGISHIENPDSGNMVDFTLVPGFYRRSYLVPNSLYESGCLPWKVTRDMRHICFRYELEWKDLVYMDATYHIVDDRNVLLEIKCVNNTSEPQNLLLQTMSSVHFEDDSSQPAKAFVPKWNATDKNFVVKYSSIARHYGIATNFPMSGVKRYENGLMDFFMKRTVHRHPPVCFHGDSLGHYTSLFQKPLVLQPKSDTTIWNLIVCGEEKYVRERIAAFHKDEQSVVKEVSSFSYDIDCIPEGERYKLGEQIIESTLLTNIVYPIKAEGQNIRHFTPGKNWNSLYTWDSGFISWALADLAPEKSFETIRAYTTEPGSDQAFIHHGTPLPTQFFAFEDLLSKTSDWEMAAFLYPRLKQYYDYFAGHDKRSNTMMPSGFVRTWDLWYSTGGWDDYPPQHDLRSHKDRYPYVAPVVSTSYYLRSAKILRMVASKLGYKSDVKQYDRDIAKMSNAVLSYAWDEDAGYFGYVVHDSDLKPVGLYRAPDGSNFNKGLDGTSPLAAGICTQHQKEVLLNNLFSEDKLWTPYGISTVDKSASYYSMDGYWNGCVWMPHQFILWKSMLDMGLTDHARQIAFTALDVWNKECSLTYLSFEHFIIASGRGAGWHNFSGLSSPMVNWFASYFRPGTISTGFDTIVESKRFSDNFDALEASLIFDKDAKGRKVAVLVCMDPSKNYSAKCNGKPVQMSSPYRGFLEITFTISSPSLRLEVFSL